MIMEKQTKGYVIVIEENRECYSEPSVYVGGHEAVVYTEQNAAMNAFHDIVRDAKEEEYGTFPWLAEGLAERPEDFTTDWVTDRYVMFSDKHSEDILRIYIVETVIKQTMNLKDTIRKEYGEHCIDYGRFPNYAECGIRFLDDGKRERVTIKLSNMDEDDEDNKVFFYCDDFTDFLRLCDKDSGEDFVIEDFITFWAS